MHCFPILPVSKGSSSIAISKDVPESQLIASMKGDTIKNEELLEDDDAELKMAKNRRVTFKYRD